MALAGTAWIKYLGDYSQLGAGSEKAVQQMAGRWKSLSKSLLGPALAAGAVVGLTHLGSEFQKAYKTIRTQTGATGKELRNLEGDFKAVLRVRPDNMQDVAAALTDVHQRLGLTGKPLQSMTKDMLRLAGITGRQVGPAIDAAAKAFGAWQVPAGQMQNRLNELFRASQKTGAPIEGLASDMAKFGQPLRQMGFGFDQSAALLGKFQKEGVNTQSVMAAMRKGLVTAAKAGEAPAQTFARVTAEIQNAGSASEANQKAIQVFGARAGPEMAAAIKQGRFAVGDLTKQIANGRDTIEKSATDTATFTAKWKTFKNAMRVGFEPIATKLFTGLTDAMTAAMPLLLGVAGAVGAMASNVNILLPALATLLAMFTTGKLVAGINAVMQAFGATSLITAGWPVLIVGAIVALVAGLVVLYRKWQPFHDAVDATWQALQVAAMAVARFAQDVWRYLQPLAKAIGSYLIEPFRTAVTIVTQLIHGDFLGALQTLVTFPLRMLSRWGAIWGQLGSLVLKGLQAAGPLLWQGLQALGGLMAQGMAALGGVIGRAVAALPGQLGRLTLTLLTWAATTAAQLGLAMLRMLPNLLGWLVEAAIRLPLYLLGLWIQIHAWVIETAVRLGIAVAGFVPQALSWIWNVVRQLPGALWRAWVAIDVWIATTAVRIGLAVARFVPAAIGWVGQVIRQLPGQLARIGTLIWDALTALPGLIAKAATGVYKAFTAMGKGIFDAIVSGIKSAAKFVGDVGATIGKAVWGWVKDHVFKPLADWGISVLGHKIKPFAKIMDVAGLQRGGMVNRPQLALIGERGPELVLPLTDPQRVAELLRQYAPQLVTTAQAGAAAGGAAAATPAPGAGGPADGVFAWADAVVARLATLPAEIAAVTQPPLTVWAAWFAQLFTQLYATVNTFAVMARVRLTLWALREVPAATIPALTIWAARVAALFNGLLAGMFASLVSWTGRMSAALAGWLGRVYAALNAAVGVWGRLGAAAGDSYVRALTGRLSGATRQVSGIVGSYAKTLASGLNPILTAVGQKPIRLAAGGVVTYAQGGLNERHVAQVAPAGAWRVWAEPETGGEAYIPLATAKRARSKAVTEAVVRRFGGMVTWLREGGVTGDAHGLNPTFLQRLQHWSAAVGEPYHITSGYRDIGQQKVLYAKYLAGTGNLAAKPGGSMHNYGLASDGNHWGNRNPGAFGLVFRVHGEPWHVEPVEARQWRGMMPAAGWGDTPGLDAGSLPKPPALPHSGLIYDVADKAMKYVYAQSLAWAANALASSAQGGPALSFAGAGGGGPAVAIGQRMAAAKGWTGAQWQALYQLWMKESGWRVNADNPTSSAFGIPQALPGSKMAAAGPNWRTDAATQIAWGLGYIAQRYGNPLAAWAHSQRFNWYGRGGLVFAHARNFDQGGTLRPGLNLVRNETGGPERLRPSGATVSIGEAHFHEGIDYDAFLRKTAFMLKAGRL